MSIHSANAANAGKVVAPVPRTSPECDGILSTIGNTPLIRLTKVLPGVKFRLFAKLEALNPGGSVKDRPALAILMEALSSGQIDHGTVIIESSSGNMGIGLAQVCRFYGLRFVCVVDPKAAAQNLAVLRAYGAEIDQITEPDPATGEFLPARLQRVQELREKIENSFWPNQYANLHNPGSHYQTTMREIDSALGGKIDYLFVATSTCGTIRGCAEYIRDHGLKTRVIAVDALGSLIFSDVKAKRMIPGLGAGLRPPLCDPTLIDGCVHVSDLDCVTGCRWLIAREAILAGGSSGAVIAAVDRVKDDIPAGASCAAILPDRGERYLDTVFDNGWVREHFGDVEHRWEGTAGASLDAARRVRTARST
jgi:2,3-diaminopropionate biosynthesis protein SbnA